MMYTLQQAADELAAEIKEYGIIVNVNQGLIGIHNELMSLKPNTSRVICKRYIRSLIRKEEDARLARHNAKQGRLFA